MTVTQFAQRALDWSIPAMLIVCVAIGSFLLWRRTKRRSAFMQLVAAAVMLLLLVFAAGHKFTTPLDDTWLAQFLWSESIGAAIPCMTAFSLVVFGCGYVWFAARAKPSN
jgi:Na+-translocating ferredoxin:NAD+ oxidoreductase RnfD subunit